MAHAAITAPATGVAQRPSTLASGWRLLFQVAGVGALLTAVLIPLQVVAFVVWPLPEGGVTEWFALFNERPLVALISYDLIMVLEEVLLIPIVVALFVILRRTSPSLAAMSAGFWLVSVALFIGSNTAFDMLALSQGYADAATQAERAAYMAAGQTALSGYMEYGTSFVVGYVLASLAGILIGVAMLRNRVFPALAGWAAIVANLLGLALFVPEIGVWLSIGSVLILVAWYALVGWRLVRLHELPEEVRHA
jgi:hypothetical protein